MGGICAVDPLQGPGTQEHAVCRSGTGARRERPLDHVSVHPPQHIRADRGPRQPVATGRDSVDHGPQLPRAGLTAARPRLGGYPARGHALPVRCAVDFHYTRSGARLDGAGVHPAGRGAAGHPGPADEGVKA
ncbi:MAG: hypothetical protein DDT40_01981 [candidate division WS2 bacterium]|nr:hypothetical protein [Candidatus Psychracetigena formicireducens]